MADMLINLINSIFVAIATFCNALANLLPASPFSSVSASLELNQFFGLLNWVFPFTQMIATLELWVTCLALYYLISIALKWVKIVGK